MYGRIGKPRNYKGADPAYLSRLERATTIYVYNQYSNPTDLMWGPLPPSF